VREEFGPLFVRNFSWPYSWGAEGENRRVQPLLAARVGLKPRITEGYERAMGLVAAFSRARDEKDFRQWPSPIDRDATPKREIRFAPLSWKTPLLPPLLRRRRGQRRPGADLGLFPDMKRAGSVELAPSSAWPRPSRAFSPREDKATAMRVLSLSGEALGVAVGAGRLYADPQGFRLASLPSWVRRP
jgi:hypothetical protein